MIWFIFDLGIGLATFVAWVVAFFREPEAGLRAHSRPWSSSETPPCSFPAGPRGRGNVFPARGADDFAQAIDYTRDYGQNPADFGAGIKILPDLRERGPPPPSEYAEPEDAVDRVEGRRALTVEAPPARPRRGRIRRASAGRRGSGRRLWPTRRRGLLAPGRRAGGSGSC